MDKEDIFGIAIMVIVIVVIISFVGFFVGSTLAYWQVHYFISDCDEDFGVGNWIFNHDDNEYSCSRSTTIVNSDFKTTSIITNSSQCYINGVEIPCGEI